VAKILKASDLFVYPSIHPEGTALSVLEAMSSGLAVIVSDIGGLSDVVADNNEGLLVPPGNSKLLSQAITKLLDDKRSRRRMGEVGRKTILDKYTVKIIAQKYLNEVFV